MRNVEPDPSELLVKALDLAVGASTLARYAAGHTSDNRVRRLFRQFASTSERQERVLRQQLGRSAAGSGQSGPREAVTYVAFGLAALVALAAGIAIFARFRGDGGDPGDPLSRAVRGARSLGSSARSALSGADGALGSGRGVSSGRGAGF